MNAQQLLAKVESIQADANGCKRWPMNVDTCGYGRVTLLGRREKAHRAVYQLLHGKLDRRTFVCHRCDVADCVNPEHLFAGTHDQNMADMKAKGRAAKVNVPNRGVGNPNSRLSESQVLAIRQRASEGESRRALGTTFGVDPRYVGLIVARKRWAHV